MALGHSYESKILSLFLIRGTDKGDEFELANNVESLGGKFDDLIFKYKVSENEEWRYRYLQAKHRMKESEQIHGAQLVQDTGEGDFSLFKYFRSYCRMISRGEDVDDCVIFTNIGFNQVDLKLNDSEIRLAKVETPDDILNFSNSILKSGKTPIRYKLILEEQLRKKLLKKSNDTVLAEKLSELASKTPDLRNEILQAYHVSLVEEKVIDVSSKKFHADFIIGSNLSGGARQLRENLVAMVGDDWEKWKLKLGNSFGKISTYSKEWPVRNPLPTAVDDVNVTDFLDKLVFAVNSPNVNELEEEVLTADVRLPAQRKLHCRNRTHYQIRELLARSKGRSCMVVDNSWKGTTLSRCLKRIKNLPETTGSRSRFQ